MTLAASVQKRNKAYTELLVSRINAVPAKVLARLTNAAVLAAVTNTYQDSGRFAWNWKVRWSHGQKGGSGTDYGDYPIGRRGEQRGAGAGPVVGLQAKEIGFKQAGWETGALYKMLVRDNPNKVLIFNPFYVGKYGGHAAEGLEGTANKQNVPQKIAEAVEREAVRANYEMKFLF